jgi:hypothetical protein
MNGAGFSKSHLLCGDLPMSHAGHQPQYSRLAAFTHHVSQAFIVISTKDLKMAAIILS